MTIWKRHAWAMDEITPKTPFELLLRITGLLRAEDLKSLLPYLPFLKEATWASGSRLLDQIQSGESGALPSMLFGVASSLADQGASRPARLLAVVIADWEALEVGVIEEILDLLGQSYPKARIEVLWLHSEGDVAFEVILAAG